MSVKHDKAAWTRTLRLGRWLFRATVVVGFKVVFGPGIPGLDDRALAPYLGTPSDVEIHLLTHSRGTQREENAR